MPKLRLGIYFDLPAGGAKNLITSYLKELKAEYELIYLSTLKPSQNRLIRDFQNFTTSYFHALSLRHYIKANKLDLVIVSHDTFFAAPSILQFCPVKTLLFWNEPTRSLFEPELAIPKTLPLVNRLYESIYRRIKKLLEQKNAQKATLILSNSKYTQNYLKTVYNLNSKVLYPFIDKQLFQRSKVIKAHKVLIIGCDEPQKRLDLALQAVAALPLKARPKLTIISPRANQKINRLQALAQKLSVRLEQYVNLDQSKLIKEYQSAQATLVTALREPFGLSALESISCGTPVIAVKEGGVVEIVKDKKTGYLVEADVVSIAKAITNIPHLASPIPQLPRYFDKKLCVTKFRQILHKLATAQISSANNLFENHNG